MPKSNKLNRIVSALNNPAGVRLPKESSGDYDKFPLDGFGDSTYRTNRGNTKEFIQISRNTMIPGVVKLMGKEYEVPKGSMKTAKAERGKTESRIKNTEKRAEKKRQPKKLY